MAASLTRRKVAVLGPIPHDRITTHRGEVFEKFGCTLYTAAALSALMGPDDVICPIVHVRREDEAPIKEALSRFGNVDVRGIRSITNQGDIVELEYVDQNTRIERQTGFMAPILPEDVEFALDADAFVCVPITDYEVGPATLAYIKSHSAGVIVFDGHGPTVTLTRGGERFNRLWVERDTWLPYIDILKMNLEEAGCSWFPERDDGPAIGAELSRDELPQFAEHCLDHGIRALCVTLDEEGCVVYYRDRDGLIREEIVGRIPVEHVVDTTGCGDSFAAGMAFGYLEHGDFIEAARYGNAMGAQRCAGSELAIYKSLEETKRQIEVIYGSGSGPSVAPAMSQER
ncbi:carbohydrate kinase family protein [Hoyosella sp. YIM 151337]|uniref:carbohydrate kinase family protein n=1 Tax=Hoyosella sp. YIM 151337 TaxID=2992742 RepID=UPI0022357CF6|nr:carbohydrate kinase family protein [Hoyosella sp. YIM 151337]MCW4355005.1 carbohydrate kinase family protein [Hoyosella sp. YIM 151337]